MSESYDYYYNNTKQNKELVKIERKMAAEEGQVIGCHTVEAWNEQFQKGKDSGKLVFIFLNFFPFFNLSIHVRYFVQDLDVVVCAFIVAGSSI